MTKVWRGGLVVLGLVSVGSLIAATGVTAVLSAMATLSWRIVVIVVCPAIVVVALDTLAWRFAFERLPPFYRLFGVRLAGEALNTGTASIGGEAAKVYLLQPEVPAVEASAATLVGKTGITIAQVLFLGVGLAVALSCLEPSPLVLTAAFVALALEAMAVAAFVLVQCAGVVGRTLRLLRRWAWHAAADRLQDLVRLDHSLATFYGRRRGRFATCVALHLAAWIVGSLEVYLVLHWLGVGVSFPMALFIDAAGSAISFVGFAVPARLGVLEGGYMSVFAALGLASGVGLSFALIRRLRLLVWSLLGVVVLMAYQATATPRASAT
ncbi:MAG TPA: lysylphosphatidylglycerol synthase transmembrane domain-containing protein [Methylomirabilota bacterium]|jgi:uncharacterized protein (TIRG00374 family)